MFGELTGVRLLALIVLVSTACTPMVRKSSGGVVPGRTVDHSAKKLILATPDGVEEDGPAEGSGQATYTAIRDALIARGVSVTTTDRTDLTDGFDQASSLGCRYLLRGTIPEWEDNATEWSAKPDVASVSLELYDVADRTLTATASHRVASSSAQLVSKRPDRFIPEIVDVSLAKMFGWQPSSPVPKWLRRVAVAGQLTTGRTRGSVPSRAFRDRLQEFDPQSLPQRARRSFQG